MSDSDEIKIPTVANIKNLLDPIFKKLEQIDIKLSDKNKSIVKSQYYRNNDLKVIFGFSSNTIIKYRETGILPYTKLGEVFLYEISEIENILNANKIS